MRVLQVHTRYRQSGGEDGVLETESRLLQSGGNDVLTWEEANPDGSTAALSLAASVWNPAAARRFRQVMDRYRPDIVHVHNTWFAMSPSVVAAPRKFDVPVVMTLHNYRLICAAATLYRDGAPCHDCVGTHPWHAVRHRCYRDSRPQSAIAAAGMAVHGSQGTWSHNVDRFLALSNFGKQQFVEGGLPAHKIVTKSNSVDDPGERPSPPSASRTVLFVGRLSTEKGVADLLEAWAVRPRRLELVIVGTGPLEEELRRAAPAGVVFAGKQTHAQVVSMMLSSRALVFPSTWYEGQPLVLLEAAAAGMAILLSDLGAMTEMFAPDSERLLFEPSNLESLSDGIQRLEEDAFVDDFGKLARRRFEERYTHEIAATRLEAIYQSLLR